ncbi:putative coA-binding, NAD(P)-binding domain superfamily [Septoria linicola]|nr:putative coA-binding, NAD(P)-binding domain superfamily [Septoria linicola]
MASKAIDMRAAAAKFFTASHFAVAGASSDPLKFGHRIFAWYLQRELPAMPLNPTIPSVTVRSRDFDTVPSPSEVTDPKTTSLSVITQPPVTAKLLQEAKEAGIHAVWLQPGSFTDKELEYAIKHWPDAAVGGYADGTVGGDGWCVLVDGETAMEGAKSLSTNAEAAETGKPARDARPRRAGHRVFKRPSKTEPVVGRKARVKKHVLDRIQRTENIRLRQILANLEG